MLPTTSDVRRSDRRWFTVLVMLLSLLSMTPHSTQAQGDRAATPVAAPTEVASTDVAPTPLVSASSDVQPNEPIAKDVSAAAGPTEGTGSVLVQIIECNDRARQGQTDFFVSEPVAAADADTSGPCSNRRADGADYTLRGISVSYQRSLSGRDGFIFFPDLAPGIYQLGNDETDARSTPFTVRAFEGTDIVVYEFDGFRPDIGTPIVDDPTAPATATVRVDICEDASRPGDTDFRILTSRNVVAPDFADTNRPGSIAATCRFARAGEVTVVLTNMGTGEERQATTDGFGGAGFGADIPPGAYTFGVGEATSTSFTLEPGGFLAAAIYLFASPETTPTATATAVAATATPPTTAPSTSVEPTADATTAAKPTATTTPTDAPTNHHAVPTATAPAGLYVTALPTTGGLHSGGSTFPLLALVLAVGFLVAALRMARDGR